MSRKSVQRFCGNDMRETKDLKAWQANLKDRDAL
jgi:hypothetical protein